MTVTVVIKHFTWNKQAGYSNNSDSCHKTLYNEQAGYSNGSDSCHKTLYLEQTDWI